MGNSIFVFIKKSKSKFYKLFILIPFLVLNLDASSFEHVYKIGNFKIFYTYYGKNKLPSHNQIDDNNNKVPDYIEYIGNQLNVSSQIFDSLEYINPLQSRRYQDKASFITVSIVSIKNNGIAFDEINRARKYETERLQPSLAMKISNKLSPKSLTPLHEYFHLIQNGYTMFKNRWYTEGTARWSESILKEGMGTNRRLPQSEYELIEILSQTYKTSLMWNRLTYLLDKNDCQITTFLGKKQVCGVQFMKNFLENLMRYDKLVSKDMQYQLYRWKEENQKSSKNNKYILEALTDTIHLEKTSNKEVIKFLNILNSYILKIN